MLRGAGSGWICSGPYRAKQLTYAALLAERAPNARAATRRGARRAYAPGIFRSHGPATIRDFVWWSGLTIVDAKRGLEMIRAKHEVVEGLTIFKRVEPKRANGHALALDSLMLPIYDEYLSPTAIAMRCRNAAVTVQSKKKAVIFQHALVAGGQVAGTWRIRRATSRRGGRGRAVEVRLTGAERQRLSDAVVQHGRLLGQPISLSIG